MHTCLLRCLPSFLFYLPRDVTFPPHCLAAGALGRRGAAHVLQGAAGPQHRLPRARRPPRPQRGPAGLGGARSLELLGERERERERAGRAGGDATDHPWLGLAKFPSLPPSPQRLNGELPQFFRENLLTSSKGSKCVDEKSD